MRLVGWSGGGGTSRMGRGLAVVGLVAAMLASLPTGATAAPSVSAVPSSGPVGTIVDVTGSGFTAGFGPCRIEFEMTPGEPGSRVVVVSENFCAVSPNGTITEEFPVPSGAKEGSSSTRIWVCSYCNGGEFAEIATAAFDVTTASPSPTPSTPSPSPSSPSPSPTSPSPTSPSPSPSPTTTSPSPSPTTSPSPSPTTSPSPTISPTTPTIDVTPSPIETVEPPSLLTDLPLVPRPTSLGTSVLSGLTVADLEPLVRPDVLRFLFPPDRCARPTGATVITFDDLSWNDGVDDQYSDQGVRFVGQPAGILRIRDAAVGSVSAPNVLANINTTRLGDRFELETARGDIAAFFEELQTDVGVFVGLVGEAPYEVTATLEARDVAGTTIATDSTTFGPGDVPVRSCLRAQQAAGTEAAIASIHVVYDPPLPEAIDDLFFASSLPQPDVRELGAVRWTRPLDGSRLTADAPVFAGEVFGTVPVERVEVIWECDNPPREPDESYWSSLSWGRVSTELLPDPANPLRTFWVATPSYISSSGCGSEVELRLKATATFEGWWTARSDISVTYVSPSMVERADPVAIAAVEPTQGVRIAPIPIGPDRTSFADPMRHVADRPTVLRVYPSLVDGLRGNTRSERLYARAIAFRDGRFLPGTETLPENGPVRIRSEATTVVDQRRGVQHTWNFRLPRSWTQPGVTRVVITAYPEGVEPGAYEACRCGDPPHTLALELTFEAGGTIDMHMFAVEHTFEATDGTTVTNPRPDLAALSAVIDQAYQYLPLPRWGFNISQLEFMDWEGPVESEDDEGVTTYHLFDAMNERYLIPAGITGPDPSHRGTMYGFYFDGTRNCGGRGWLDQAFFNTGACDWATTPTHESLHTLGLSHASNRHDEAGGGGFDASFPGICGQISYDGSGRLDARTFGVDVHATPIRIIVPDSPGGEATPDEDGDCADRHVHDVLSYGWGQKWLSPYIWRHTNIRLGGPRVAVASFAQDTPVESEVIRLRVREDSAEVLGSLVAAATPYDGPSAIVVRARERAGGAVVAEHPLAIHEPESGRPMPVGTGNAILPIDGWSVLEVVRGDTVIETIEFDPATAPQLVSPTAGAEITDSVEVTWRGPTEKAFVQVSDDDGMTWRTVAVTTDNPVTVAVDDLGLDIGDALLRVQAGADELAAASEPVQITVGAAEPLPLILSPQPNEPVQPGEVLELTGQAFTRGGGNIGPTDLHWFVDGTQVGSGNSWVVVGLEEGLHEVELRATYGGVEATATRTVRVGVDSDRDGILDADEAAFGLDAEDAADAGADQDGDGLDARTEIERGTDPAAPDTDGDRYADMVELMGGGDPLDPESHPGPSHEWDGEWPMLPAATEDAGQSDSNSTALLIGLLVALAVVAGSGAWWASRRSTGVPPEEP